MKVSIVLDSMRAQEFLTCGTLVDKMDPMVSRTIEPAKKLSGQITLPGDKSISHRAVMLGSIAKGTTRITNVLDSDDCNYTTRAFRDMGIRIERRKDITIIEGKGLRALKKPKRSLHVGNSGTSMRLLSGILAGQHFTSTLTGDSSLSNRPMDRIVLPLSRMGVDIKAAPGGYPPIRIHGGSVFPIDYKVPIPSAQVKSAILFAGLYADGTTTVEERFKSRDHTERMMKYFGADLKIRGLKVAVKGGRELAAKEFEVPGDISSASFFIVAAILLKNSKIRINKVSINPTRSLILKVLSKMGADVKVIGKKGLFEPVGDIEIGSGKTKGIVIGEESIPGIIDELPILFVLASLSPGRTVIKGAGELKVKETDRIRSMKINLENMGSRVELKGDDVIIHGVKKLKGHAALQSFGDHRTCMAMTIAALTAEGPSGIDDVGCVSKSFPEFFKVLGALKS